MARAVKKRNTDSSKFQDAVDASEEQDNDGTGVEHDAAGPVYLEKLSDAERAQAGELLADKLLDLAEVEQDAKDTAAKFRKDIKARRKAIATLRDEVHQGMRKTSAQKALPGTEAH
jgi:hypothetical protein